MMIDLSGMSRAELVALQSEIEKAMKTLAQKEIRLAREAAERAAREHGFTLTEVMGGGVATRNTRSGTRGKLPPRYRNPADPSQTWSGRGRKPAWIKEADAAGRPLSDFEI